MIVVNMGIFIAPVGSHQDTGTTKKGLILDTTSAVGAQLNYYQ